MTDLRKLKDRATEAFTKGKFAKAAEIYEEYCQKDSKDLQARLRMGDAFAKAGDRGKAILAYKAAAEGFARDGFLPRAIAASKLILELDPSHKGVQQMLADLYAKRSSGDGRPGRGPGAGPLVGSRSAPAGLGRTPALTEPPPVGVPESEGIELSVEGPPPDLSSELPPELDVKLAPPPGPAPAAPPGPAVPPGLKPRRPPAPAVKPAPAPSRFDELDLDMAPPDTAPEAPSLTGLEGDSLLHAVEMAAKVGMSQRQEVVAAAQEEAISDTAGGGEADRASGLPKIPLFSDLAPDAFIELFERCPLRRFRQGERIIEQGSQGNSFFVICGGGVKVLREDGGARKELATLQEGAFFGEMAFLSGAPRTASVESCSDDTQLLEISAPLLAQLSHRHPQVAQALKKFCRQRLLSNVMSTSAFFRPFGKKDRKELVEHFRARDVQRGTVIIREGERSEGLYVLLSGEVEVQKGGHPLAVLKEGDIFGEMSLLNKTPATATVRARKYTSLLRLPREDFDAIILSHPQLLTLISELTQDRARQTEAALGAQAGAEEGEELLLI